MTLQEWLRRYRECGLDGLLERKRTNCGRPRAIPDWEAVALKKRLQEPQGFDSYQEICEWLDSKLGISAKYKTVHQLVHYRLLTSCTNRRHPYKVNKQDQTYTRDE